jgi:hypothetical protein
MKPILSALLVLAVATPASAVDTTSPYAGQETREIKALDPAEIQGLLAGKGLGYAKSAELNHYQGPAHVLELAAELELSETQVNATRALHSRMEKQAKVVGAQVVAAEAALEASFREGSASEGSLESSLGEIAQLQAKLRAVHLVAHLEQRRLLSPEQVARYVRLRGYHEGEHTSHGHRH